MRLTFEPTACEGVYAVSLLDSLAPVEHIHELLTQEPGWDQQLPGSTDTARWAVSSLYNYQASQVMLQKFCMWFNQPAVKRQLLELAMQDPIFQDFWSRPDLECFDAISSSYAFYVETPAEFEDHPWHTDSKNLVVQGMLYIINEESEKQGTWFTRDSEVLRNESWAELTKISARPFGGWLLINSDRSYHRGLNYSSEPRYCIKFGIQLNTQKPPLKS
jgi:hypothetical protein